MRMLGGVVATLGIVVGCGGSPPVAATVGQVGGSLSAHAQAVPAGAEVCAMKEALAEAPKPNPEMAKTCAKAQKSDRVWRGSMTVLAAYGETLSSVARGGDEKKSGQLEAALTGIEGTGWAEAEDAKEKAARDAAAELVKQMGEEREDGSLEARVKAAAPHVTTICDGLAPYLEEQAKGFADLQTDVEAKKKTPLARRCAMLNNAPVCVSDGMADRMIYAHTFGHLGAMEANHRDAHTAVAAFCAAHDKLDKAAAAGKSDDETYQEVLQAVRDVTGGGGNAGIGEAAPASESPPAGGETPGGAEKAPAETPAPPADLPPK